MSIPTTDAVKFKNPTVVKKIALNMTDIQKNSNKSYFMEMHQEGSDFALRTEFSRTGKSPQVDYRYGLKNEIEREWSRLLSSKQKKGYKIVETIETHPQEAVVTAKKPTKSGLDPAVAQFIMNICDISGTYLKTTITAPLGTLTLSQVKRAEEVLEKIRDHNENRPARITNGWMNDLRQMCNKYYSLMPQVLPSRLDDSILIQSQPQFKKQEDLLETARDATRIGIQVYDAPVDEQYKKIGADIMPASKEEVQRIVDFITKTRSDGRGYRNIGSIHIGQVLKVVRNEEGGRYRDDLAKLTEVEVLHGTRRANVMGICSRGLLTSKASSGGLFGPGIYGAIQSAKSMQYCDGSYNDLQYMFLVKMAMGKYYTASHTLGRSYSNYVGKGYDSVWAKAGTNLYHDELIVYDSSQTKLCYVVSFER